MRKIIYAIAAAATFAPLSLAQGPANGAYSDG
jgi:hypothetical protein